MIYINRLGKIIEGEDSGTYIYINRSEKGFGEDFYIYSSRNRDFEGEVFDNWVQNDEELFAFIHQFEWSIQWLEGADVNPGENIYPEFWTSRKILEVLQDAYTSPNLIWTKIEEKGFSLYAKSNRFFSHFKIEEQEIEIVIEPHGGGMVTSYPLHFR